MRRAIALAVMGAMALGGCGRDKPAREEVPASRPRPAPQRPEPQPPRPEPRPPPPPALAPAPATLAPEGPRALLAAAIAAHGGIESLRKLESLQLEIAGRGPGERPYAATLLWRSPASRLLLTSVDGETRAIGVTPDACWRLNTLRVVLPCDDEARRTATLAASVLRARLLYPLEGEPLALAAGTRIGDVEAEAMTAGPLTLAFHPVSHLLVQVSYTDRGRAIAETTTEYRDVDGAIVASRIQTSSGGDIDDATVTDMTPDAAADELLRPPRQIEDGSAFRIALPARTVAWIDRRRPGLSDALAVLSSYAARHRISVDSDGGLMVTVAPGGLTRYAIGIGGAARDDGDVHVSTLAPSEVAGVVHVGSYERTAELRPAVERMLRERGITPAIGATWQVVTFHDPATTPEAQRVSVLQLPIADPPLPADQ